MSQKKFKKKLTFEERLNDQKMYALVAIRSRDWISDVLCAFLFLIDRMTKTKILRNGDFFSLFCNVFDVFISRFFEVFN